MVNDLLKVLGGLVAEQAHVGEESLAQSLRHGFVAAALGRDCIAPIVLELQVPAAPLNFSLILF